MIRPLRNRKLVSRKYWGQTLLEGRIPKKGKRMMGRRAVTDRGRASVHQYTAMSRMTYRQRPSCVWSRGMNTCQWLMHQVRGDGGRGTKVQAREAVVSIILPSYKMRKLSAPQVSSEV